MWSAECRRPALRPVPLALAQPSSFGVGKELVSLQRIPEFDLLGRREYLADVTDLTSKAPLTPGSIRCLRSLLFRQRERRIGFRAARRIHSARRHVGTRRESSPAHKRE